MIAGAVKSDAVTQAAQAIRRESAVPMAAAHAPGSAYEGEAPGETSTRTMACSGWKCSRITAPVADLSGA